MELTLGAEGGGELIISREEWKEDERRLCKWDEFYDYEETVVGFIMARVFVLEFLG